MAGEGQREFPRLQKQRLQGADVSSGLKESTQLKPGLPWRGQGCGSLAGREVTAGPARNLLLGVPREAAGGRALLERELGKAALGKRQCCRSQME